MVKINQMKKDELFEGFYLIKSADLRQTRAGKNYLAFVFQDETGTIEDVYKRQTFPRCGERDLNPHARRGTCA